jgi:hypothetical protein
MKKLQDPGLKSSGNYSFDIPSNLLATVLSPTRSLWLFNSFRSRDPCGPSHLLFRCLSFCVKYNGTLANRTQTANDLPGDVSFALY